MTIRSAIAWLGARSLPIVLVVLFAIVAWGLVQRQTVITRTIERDAARSQRDTAADALAEVVILPDARGKRTRDVPTLVRAAATYRVAQAKAVATATTAARRVETRNTAVTKEFNDALPVRLAAARLDAARAAGRVCPNAAGDRRSADTTRDLPGTPDATFDPARPGQAPVVDVRADLEACASAVVKAEGWREWWGRVATPVQ